MPRNRPLIVSMVLMPIFTLVWVSCSPMLSTRTDEQAWLDYMKELRARRAPASSRIVEKFPEFSLRKILLSCNDSHQIESCYRSKALVAFDSVFKNEPNYKKLQAEFFSAYSYERVFAEVQAFHQVLLSGMDLRAADHARDLHRRCEEEDEGGVTIRSFRPYLGGDTDIPKAYYHCLNEEFEKDEDLLLTETSERLGLTIVTEEARQWIRQRQIHPVYEKYTHDYFHKQMHLEKEKWNSEKTRIASRFEKGESLNAAVKRLSAELRRQYRFLPVEVYLTALHTEHKKGAP